MSYHNIHLKGIHFDTMLVAHLIDSRQSIGLKALAKSIFDFEMVEFDALMKDVSSILELDVKLLASYVADDSNVTYHLYEQFDQMLSGKLRSLFLDLEMPLVNVLSDMELAGVQCDINYLHRLSKDYSAELHQLTQSIYKMANNHEFNINSTQQLGEVLFDQLKLPVIKKQNRTFDRFFCFRKIG